MATLPSDLKGDATCDFCDEAAVLHATEIVDGRTASRHLCARHAAEAGYGEVLTSAPATTRAAGAAESYIDNLRGTANFVRRYGHMPSSVTELMEGMALREPFPMADSIAPELQGPLRQWEALLRFYESHHRLSDAIEDTQPPA
jgi:hypothetical protein